MLSNQDSTLPVQGFHQGSDLSRQGCVNCGCDCDMKMTDQNETGAKQTVKKVCSPPGEVQRSIHVTVP